MPYGSPTRSSFRLDEDRSGLSVAETVAIFPPTFVVPQGIELIGEKATTE